MNIPYDKKYCSTITNPIKRAKWIVVETKNTNAEIYTFNNKGNPWALIFKEKAK